MPVKTVATRRRRCYNLAAAMRFRLLQLFFCLLVGVGFVALFELGERSSGYFELVPDAATGVVRYRPGATIRWGREGYGATTIGPHGMIVNKPLGDGPRVLFLGDSFTEALQVNDAEKFTEIAQDEYNRRFPARPVTLLNFALSGHSAPQIVSDAAALAPVLRPRVVVAQLSRFDFAPADAKRQLPTQPAYLAYRADGAPEIRRHEIAPRPRFVRFLQDARLFSTLGRLRWRLQSLTGDPAAENGVENSPGGSGSSDLAEYRRLTRFLLAELRQICADNSAALAVLYTPRVPQLHGARLLTDEKGFGPAAEDERAIFLDACRELGVPVWDTSPRLKEYFARTGQFPNGFANSRPGFGHLNAAGHRVVAEMIVEELSRLIKTEE
jgi:lysophospholipase L1-like esterase